MSLRSSAALAFVTFAHGLVPAWPPTWNLQLSTIIQPCNLSGWLDPVFYSQFGIVDVDWSNQKDRWVTTVPFDDQELLPDQCALLVAQNPKLRCFVYRNLVKALPWYTSVREKINDPAYSGWFLPFKPGGEILCEAASACAALHPCSGVSTFQTTQATFRTAPTTFPSVTLRGIHLAARASTTTRSRVSVYQSCCRSPTCRLAPFFPLQRPRLARSQHPETRLADFAEGRATVAASPAANVSAGLLPKHA